MNSLSWLLYLADVIGNVQGLLVTLSLVSGVGLVLWLVIGQLNIDSDWEFPKADKQTRSAKHAKKVFKYLWVPVIAAFVAAIIPARETIYLIAGSEAGEAVVTSEEGKEILNDIREVIKGQLDALKPQAQ